MSITSSLLTLGLLIGALICIFRLASYLGDKKQKVGGARATSLRAGPAVSQAPHRDRTRRLEGRFRPIRQQPASGGSFRPIRHRTEPRNRTLKREPNKTGNGKLRALGKPTEPAVDWVTGRILRP
jgi:hypothetical protein